MGDADDATVLSDMVNNYSTVFTRKTFTCYNVSTVSKISILYEYDDGFVVYLNGTRIFEQRAPAVITNTSLATSTHEINSTVNLIRQDLTACRDPGAARERHERPGCGGVEQHAQQQRPDAQDHARADRRHRDAGRCRRRFDGRGTEVHGSRHRTRYRHDAAPVHTRQPGTVRWSIFDPAGRLVRRMESGSLTAGRQTVEWDGRDGRGRAVVPGVYLYRLQGTRWEHRGKVTVTH
jgi:hypothetical protein